MSLTILTLEGHLGRDPEVRYSADGKEFCHFPVAANNNKTKQVSWYNVTCTGGLVGVATKYLKKGDPVLVIGNFNPREYTNNGVKGISLDVFANVIDLIGSKANASNGEDPEDFNPELYEQEQAASSKTTNTNISAKTTTVTAKAK